MHCSLPALSPPPPRTSTPLLTAGACACAALRRAAAACRRSRRPTRRTRGRSTRSTRRGGRPCCKHTNRRVVAIGPQVATHACTRLHTRTHTRTHAHTHTQTHTHTHKRARARTNACTHPPTLCARAPTHADVDASMGMQACANEAQARAQASAWSLLGSAGATGNRRQYRRTRARSRPVLTCSAFIGAVTSRYSATATQRRRGCDAVAAGEPMTHREEKLVAHKRLEHLPRLLGFAAREADDDREEAEEACNATQRNAMQRTAPHRSAPRRRPCTGLHERHGIARRKKSRPYAYKRVKHPYPTTRYPPVADGPASPKPGVISHAARYPVGEPLSTRPPGLPTYLRR